MTPVWVPLIVGVLGLVGILLTQWSANQRAEKDRRHADEREDKRASVEAAQRAVEWARRQRRDAHANFLAEQWRAEHMMTMYNQVGGSSPPPDWTEPMARELGLVRIFGSPEAFKAANALLRITIEMESPSWGVGRYLDLDTAKDNYVAAIRRDLGLDPHAPQTMESEPEQ